MALSDLDLGDRTSRDVAAAELEPGGERVLCHLPPLSDPTDVISDFRFNRFVHDQPLCTYLGAFQVDPIIIQCYNVFAPI